MGVAASSQKTVFQGPFKASVEPPAWEHSGWEAVLALLAEMELRAVDAGLRASGSGFKQNATPPSAMCGSSVATLREHQVAWSQTGTAS